MTVYKYSKPKDIEPTGAPVMDLICQPGERSRRIQQAPSPKELESIRRAAYAVAADGYKAASDRYYDVHQHQLQALETMKSSGYALGQLRSKLKGCIVNLNQYLDILRERFQDCQKREEHSLAQEYYHQLQELHYLKKDLKTDIARCDQEVIKYKDAVRFCEEKAYEVVEPGDNRSKKYQHYNRLSDADA